MDDANGLDGSDGSVGPRARAVRFCARFGLRVPLLQAPMAGACPPELAVAVAAAGGMGANGVVLDAPERIESWVRQFRAGSTGALQLNIWIPETAADDPGAVAAASEFMNRFGTPGRAGPPPPVFDDQCEAMLAARPTVVSSIMGLLGPDYVRRLHEQGIAWFACATTLAEAVAAQDAGADAVVVQGAEAGGHRGTFDPRATVASQVGLFALLPWCVDRLSVPVVAAGGITDGRGVAAALALGASAVQVGTALLRTPEAAVEHGWARSLEALAPEATTITRAYSGRLGRAVTTDYVRAWAGPDAPEPAPHPHQRRLVARFRRGSSPGIDRINCWAGQGAALATVQPAADVVATMWDEADALLA